MMKFLRTFQVSIEKTMNDIGKDITKKIDDKLAVLDKGLDNLTIEVRNNDTKQEENHKKLADKQDMNLKKLEDRLNKLETDVDRQKFARTKANSKYLNGNPDEVFNREGQKVNKPDKLFHREGRQNIGNNSTNTPQTRLYSS